MWKHIERVSLTMDKIKINYIVQNDIKLFDERKIIVDSEVKLTKKDAYFFMEMVGWNQYLVPKVYKVKPYFKVLSKRNSGDYNRFIAIYKLKRNILSERELEILNKFYGVDQDNLSLKKIAEILNISPERVRQIRNEAEDKIVKELLIILKDNTK